MQIKLKELRVGWFMIYFVIYFILVCFSVYQYYAAYSWLESNVVLVAAVVINSLLSTLFVIVFIQYGKIRNAKQSVLRKHLLKTNSGFWTIVQIFLLFVILLMIVTPGLITFINANLGCQQHITVGAILRNVTKSTGRGGGNVQYYYVFEALQTHKVFVLRSAHKYIIDKQVELDLFRGSLGIWYKR